MGETLFEGQLKIEELGTNIDLKDADVKLYVRHFIKVFVLHLLYFTVFGPALTVVTCFKYHQLLQNMGLTLSTASPTFLFASLV